MVIFLQMYNLRQFWIIVVLRIVLIYKALHHDGVI